VSNNLEKKQLTKFAIYIISFLIAFILVTYLSREIYLHNKSAVSDDIWLKKFENVKVKDKYRVAVIYSENTHYSISAAAKKITEQAKNKGWDVILISDVFDIESGLDDYKPDFVISLMDEQNFNGMKIKYPTYGYLIWATNKYFDNKFTFKPQLLEKLYPDIHKLDGFICSFKAISLLKDYIESKGKKFYAFRSFTYHNPTEYQELKYKKIIYYGENLDRFKNNKFKILFGQLIENKMIDVFGTSNLANYLEYKHYNLEKMSMNDIIKNIQAHGISLIIHSKKQNDDGIPSSRFFESVSAGAIVISDRNSFIEKNYGDYVLFVDTEMSAQKMFDQISKHYKWIKKNPKKVAKLTAMAHKKMLSQHNLDAELTKISQMHEKNCQDKLKLKP
jgi:hypothetical protein